MYVAHRVSCDSDQSLLFHHQPCVVVKQLTLDIEHYLGESVRTTAEWGHRYIAFTDYDVQIVEVCTVSRLYII